MGIKNLGLETPDYSKTWSCILVFAFRRRNLLPLKTGATNTQRWYEYTSEFCSFTSRVAVAYVRFRLYKRLCLERVPRANAPLVYRFHSLTHPPSLAYMEIALSWNIQRFARLLFVMYSGWLTRSMCCIMLPPAVNLRMTCYYLQIPALKCHKFWINS